MRKLSRKQRQVESRIAERNRLKGQSFERAFSLLNEAKSVELIAADNQFRDSWEVVRELIESALATNIDNDLSGPNADILNELLDRQQQIRDSHRVASSELKALKELKGSASGFGSEAGEQKSRLESINVFERTNNSSACPLCSSALSNTVPSVEAIRASLNKIDSQLEAVTNDTPHLDKLIVKAEEHLEKIKKQFDEVKFSIASLQKTDVHISELRDFNSRRAMVKAASVFTWRIYLQVIVMIAMTN